MIVCGAVSTASADKLLDVQLALYRLHQAFATSPATNDDESRQRYLPLQQKWVLHGMVGAFSMHLSLHLMTHSIGHSKHVGPSTAVGMHMCTCTQVT